MEVVAVHALEQGDAQAFGLEAAGAIVRFFALQVVRKPKDGMITCAGGGYIASGPVEKSKMPFPAMPVGLEYVDLEGAGEVQTPLILPSDAPQINFGDPIFFQHAKAGELCERFNELILIYRIFVVLLADN